MKRFRTGESPLLYYAVAYLGLVTLVEVATVYFHPVLGMAGYSLLLGVLMLHATRTADAHGCVFLLAVALVPLSRVVALGVPERTLPDEWRFLLTSLPILAAAFVVVRTTGLTWSSVQLQLPTRRMLFPVIIVACMGVVIGVAMYEYSLLWPTGAASSFDAETLVEASLVFALVTGVTEEITFRGIVQTSGTNALGVRAGVTLASSLYAVLHIGHRSDMGVEFVALDVLFVFAVGMFFGIATRMTRSLAGAILAHSLITVTLLLGIPLLWK